MGYYLLIVGVTVVPILLWLAIKRFPQHKDKIIAIVRSLPDIVVLLHNQRLLNKKYAYMLQSSFFPFMRMLNSSGELTPELKLNIKQFITSFSPVYGEKVNSKRAENIAVATYIVMFHHKELAENIRFF